MKKFVFALLVAVVVAKELELNFNEKGNDYKEKIKVSKTNVEFDVPKHEDRDQAEYLNDYQVGLNIMKVDRLKMCYAYDMPGDEFLPDEIEAGVKQFGNKFPEHKYMVLKNNILPLYYLNGSELTDKIRDFCGPFPVMKVATFKNQAEMETAVLTTMKAKLAGHRQKRATLTEFYLCDYKSGQFINECGRTGKKLKIKCKFVQAQTCVFKIGCNQKGTGFDCPVPAHMFHYLHCCDYEC